MAVVEIVDKRTNFRRHERDFYETPFEAIVPLVSHLPHSVRFDEPCAGNGALIRHLEEFNAVCISKGDINDGQDALQIQGTPADIFITNPPWKWETLSKLIPHLYNIAPCWLLLNADLMHNKRMAPHMARCRKVVSVGRVSWMQNGIKGFENCAWYLFGKDAEETIFYARAA